MAVYESKIRTLVELRALNVSRFVTVVRLEHCLPVVNAAKQLLELVDVDRGRLVFVIQICKHEVP